MDLYIHLHSTRGPSVTSEDKWSYKRNLFFDVCCTQHIQHRSKTTDNLKYRLFSGNVPCADDCLDIGPPNVWDHLSTTIILYENAPFMKWFAFMPKSGTQATHAPCLYPATFVILASPCPCTNWAIYMIYIMNEQCTISPMIVIKLTWNRDEYA